jgi:hypothetical protein
VKITLGRAIRDLDQLDLDLVASHLPVLQARGLYERALLSAYVNTIHAHWPQAAIIVLFRLANPARLRALGDRLNGRGPLTVFQGRSARHDEAGLSWTLDLERAREFATHHAEPAVWTGTVAAPDVLAYVNRQEEEEILALPERVTGQRRVE